MVNNPSWYATFEDILKDPGTYWELVSQGRVVANSALAKWGNGIWWKDLRNIADAFDENVVLAQLKSQYGEDNIVSQVTLEVEKLDGTIVTIRADHLVFRRLTSEYIIIDSKYTTKAKNWQTDWLASCTDNQQIVFPWFQSGQVKTIKVKATDTQKLANLSGIGLSNNSPIAFNTTKLQIFGSVPKQQQIQTIVNLK